MPVGFEISDELDRDYPRQIRRAQLKRLKDAATVGFNWSQEQAPEDTGNLRRTGFPPEQRGDSIVWGYTAPYASAQEFGTQPFRAPFQPLLEWAERNGGGYGLANYVWNKIAEEGIEEKRFARAGRDKQIQYLKSHSFGDYFEDQQE